MKILIESKAKLRFIYLFARGSLRTELAVPDDVLEVIGDVVECDGNFKFMHRVVNSDEVTFFILNN